MTKRRLREGERTKKGEGKKVGIDKKGVCKDRESECSQRRKRYPFPWTDQPCFFKIMIGCFQEFLFIPPKFADNLVRLVNRYVCLKDYCGKLSKVKVSRLDGSLVFQEGWPDFVVDHSISIGEMLVFKYVSRTVLLVQIFGISACERISFVEENCGNFCQKDITKIESPPEDLQFPIRHKSFKAQKDKYRVSEKNSETKSDLSIPGSKIREDDCVEENLARHEHGQLECHIASAVPCATSEIKNQTVCYWDIIPYKPKHNSQILGMRGDQTLETVRAMLILPEVVCKLLITEEGVCHLINHGFEKKFTANIMTPTGLASRELATCISCNNIVPMAQHTSYLFASVPEVNCLSSTVDNVKDETSNGMHANRQNGHISGFSSLVRGMGSIVQDLPAVETTEGNTCQSGMLHDPLEAVDEKDGTLYASQNIKVAKFEAMDLDDPFPQNSFCFSITLSSNPMCWLELPLGLPTHKGLKKQRSKVVILQDPSHRLWPVLYLDSSDFIGFSSGWESFAIANNLQLGNQCEFFYAVCNDSLKKFAEGTDVFQVQISQA